MSEGKKSETKTPKASKSKKAEPKPKREKPPKEDLVVFAIRLTEAERNVIHEAAGPRNATRFVRAVALAAAGDDESAFKRAISEAKKLRA
jgi:hypothetical protein